MILMWHRVDSQVAASGMSGPVKQYDLTKLPPPGTQQITNSAASAQPRRIPIETYYRGQPTANTNPHAAKAPEQPEQWYKSSTTKAEEWCKLVSCMYQQNGAWLLTRKFRLAVLKR